MDVTLIIVVGLVVALVAALRPVRRKNRHKRYEKVILPHIDVDYKVEKEMG